MAIDYSQFFQPNAFGSWAPRTGGALIGPTVPSLTPAWPGGSPWGANLGFGGALPQLAAPSASPAPAPPTPAQTGTPTAPPAAAGAGPALSPMNITPPAQQPGGPALSTMADPAAGAVTGGGGGGVSTMASPAAMAANWGQYASSLANWFKQQQPGMPPPMAPINIPQPHGAGLLYSLGGLGRPTGT